MSLMHLSILLWLPFLVGVIGLLLPARTAAPLAILGSGLTLVLAIAFAIDFDSGGAALQHVTDQAWIGSLGVRYQLALTGLNVWLVLLAAAGFFFGVLWTVFETGDQQAPRVRYFLIALGQVSVIGALLAQDLILFVAFFDLMLIPFYLLALAGDPARPSDREQRVSAVTKMVIFTLVGSLLMLVGAVAAGVLSTPDGQQISFSIQEIIQRGVPKGSQGWIFACFAAAFLVKLPAVPLHGWMRDAYLAMPLPLLAIFSGVLSKVAAYGFLQIAIPALPEGAADLRWVIIVIAVAGILYASLIALTTTNARLILGYSSIAQLGFILLGIFTLRADGSAGALLQAVNHGLVVLPAFAAVAVLSARAGGSEDISDFGGIAFKAPVFAVLMVIVAYALLAIPGSSNFVGEFMILRGAWEVSPVVAIIASVGVALAAVYALRWFITSVHGRVGPKVQGRELKPGELLLLAAPVLAIIALGFHPQQTLSDGERSAARSVAAAATALQAPASKEAAR